MRESTTRTCPSFCILPARRTRPASLASSTALRLDENSSQQRSGTEGKGKGYKAHGTVSVRAGSRGCLRTVNGGMSPQASKNKSKTRCSARVLPRPAAGVSVKVMPGSSSRQIQLRKFLH